MKTILGTNASGKVLLVSEWQDASCIPTDFNGAAITAHTLTDDQLVAFKYLPADRSGTMFDGQTFTALTAPPPGHLQKIAAMEAASPITHRALREFFIGFGVANPAFQATLLYQRAKTVDDAIKIERAKL